MRKYPDLSDTCDAEELADLNADPWMVELLRVNPSYVFWGPHEDYMIVRGEGWNSPIFSESWTAFRGPDPTFPDEAHLKGWELDELNECVNFYFQVTRNSVKCTACDESGYNPATKVIADDFYDFDERGTRWCDNITQDEVDALIENGRLHQYDDEKKAWVRATRTAEEVNAVNGHGARGPWKNDLRPHDAINRWILIETRAKRLGCYGKCEHCHGKGRVYVEPKAHVSLVLWMIHPRKGAGRGIEIKNIKREDLPGIFAYLQTAAERNASRFSGIAKLPDGLKDGA